MTWGRLRRLLKGIPEDRIPEVASTAERAMYNTWFAWNAIATRSEARGNEFWVLPIRQ